MPIDYRPCQTNEEFEAVKALEVSIWQMPKHEAITTHTLHVLQHTGGIVMGAFDDDTMIGMAVAFPTKTAGLIWSHMAGVHPDYQGQGIGYQIKQAQREIALGLGYSEMRWTFDPAMRGNAHFNFHLLGVTSNIYHHNFYGVMSDGINAGVPSDRFEVVWDLASDAPQDDYPDDLEFLLRSDEGVPVISAQTRHTYHAVQCPYDFQAVKAQNLDLAIQWRQSMREVLQSAFAGGYDVVDFVNQREVEQCYYVLRR